MELEIRRVEVEDKGQWTCRVWNSEGSIIRNFTLHIIGKSLRTFVFSAGVDSRFWVWVSERKQCLKCLVATKYLFQSSAKVTFWTQLLNFNQLTNKSLTLLIAVLHFSCRFQISVTFIWHPKPKQRMCQHPKLAYVNGLAPKIRRLSPTLISCVSGTNIARFVFGALGSFV